MVGIRRTVFNPEGEAFVPEHERFAYEQRRGQMSDQLAREQLQAYMQDRAAQRQHEVGMGGSFGQRSALEREMGGTFDQRTRSQMDLAALMDRGNTDRARIANEPAMAGIALQGRQYDDLSPAIKARTQAEADLLGIRGNFLKQAMGASAGGGAAGGGAMADPEVQTALMGSVLGTKLPSPREIEMQRLQDQMLREQIARQRAQQAMESGDMDAARKIAAESGVPLPVGRPEDVMAQNPALAQDLAGLTKGFASRDTSMFGWDPTTQDEDAIIAERDRLVQILVGRGVPPDRALAEANRVIVMNLGEDQNDVNAGWIQSLRQRLGRGGA